MPDISMVCERRLAAARYFGNYRLVVSTNGPPIQDSSIGLRKHVAPITPEMWKRTTSLKNYRFVIMRNGPIPDSLDAAVQKHIVPWTGFK